MKLFALLFTFSVVSHCTMASMTGHNVDIVKRHLRWNKPDIVSNVSAGNNLEIEYLQPHNRSVGVSDTKANYIAFTLYMRNGEWIVPNTGVFHFTDLKTAASLKSNCIPSTNLAGAYYHFYEICPSIDTNIVASGWCYRGLNGLFFSSDTFNSAGATYMDGQYYLNTDGTVHSDERELLSKCFKLWKNSGFSLNDWKCPTTDAVQVGPPGGSVRKKRSSDVCSSCDCLSKGPESFKGRDSVMFAFVFYILSIHLF